IIKEERIKERKAPKQYKESDMVKQIKKKKAKEKRLVVTSIICMCLVLVGAVVTYFVAEYEAQRKFERDKKAAREAAIVDSSKALEKYFRCIQSGDYSQLYLCVDNATKAKRSEENFSFLNKVFYGEINLVEIEATVNKCELVSKGVDKESDSSTEDKFGASKTKIDFTTKITTDSSEFSFDNSTTMVKEDDVWHVEWDTSIIYPDYKPLDKITTTYASTLRGTIFDRDGNELATIKDNARYYPYSNAAAHLVGFVSKITSAELNERRENGDMAYGANSIIGKKGLEYAFESKVKGKGGQKITLSDSEGNEKKVLLDSEPQKGEDLKTTIDVDIQKALYEEIKNEKGCSVAINPYTGDILALVSAPSYDNNGVMKGTASDTYNRFARSYAPGSTFKPLTGAIGLDAGTFTADTSFGRSPMRWQNSSSWGDLYVTTTHSSSGKLKDAITVSDNVYFAKAAIRIGSSKMRDSLEKIGFNEQLPIEMNFNASQYSNSETFTSEAMLANSGYGQGQILMNPLHLASIYSAFVNEGNMIKPRFTSEGEPEYWKKNAFKKETATTILDCLENVVRAGTATRLRSSSLVVAGKTGTAEIKSSQDDTSGTELGWFVAVTPKEEKEDAIIIVTMIENVKNRGGSSFVVGKTRNMLKKIYSKY
ncbi:MAG: hypothetical protein IJ272_05545, partial [Clostridia bacterium]|nr:hypothetical protein [Clostridia bacterium]